MKGIRLARELAMLGAESAMAVPPDQLVDAHAGWSVHAERWAALGARMRGHAEGGPQEATDEDSALRERLRGAFGLSEAGYWLVLCCAAVELFPEAAAAMSLLAEDERVHVVTPMAFARLMRASLGIPVATALGEALGGGATQRLRLVEVVDLGQGRPLAQQGLRLAREELGALLSGGEGVGAVRSLLVRREAPARGLVHDAQLVAGTASLLEARGVLCIRSRSPRSSRQLALDVATQLGCEALLVSPGEELPALAEMGRLRTGLPVLDLSAWPAEKPLPLAQIATASHLLRSLVVLVGSSAATGTFTALSVEPLDAEQGARAWSMVVQDAEQVEWLSRRFRLGVDEARGAVREAEDRLSAARVERPPGLSDLVDAIRAQGSRRMGRMVELVRSTARLPDLVVPPALRRQLEDIVSWYAAAERVRRDYRVGRQGPLGQGLSCLFSGQPGTGKTFAAQCLASEMGLNLYRIDLSQVVSKYIGETEKALSQVFDEAEAGHGVLLFDEADALFGKRTEVKDAHDRYANVEVGYLLQRLEAFSGVAILTTNLRSNIDTAFVRRLRFVLEFPMPDVQWRAQLWEQALPPSRLRGADLDLTHFINGFRLSGGHIHNIGIAAAHLAAASRDGLLSTELLVRATFRELEKSGLSRSPADFGALAAYLPEERR
ncbi:ATP-binding protein [Pyxidicoccus fallax]|uniref:ATP-binding protein n=1 Tax=Pyxidicoccus fallax TaxID=394095 RepID=A0A848LWR5_9BACT|nr:ATP-binding protein [Pyxidicoccus fallax]NMO21853.1 ATP-binding protein [Pyxidicoccus fallax]NPC83315.1 ATP-binding protein [Pyxidicoccus fallax]